AELPRQIRYLRNYPTIRGAVFFSSKSFDNNPNGWDDSLRNNYYSYPALIPPMPWIDSAKPRPPELHIEYNQKDLSGTAWLSKGNPQDTLRGYAIYQSDSAGLDVSASPAYQFIPYDPVAGFTIYNKPEEKGAIRFYFVTAISTTNVESDPVPIIFSNFGSK
ncbi:MAG TPA: hypothetical protein VN616_11585, partial [Puia sp.]|nr:hypothetical protein [Puia sp.]